LSYGRIVKDAGLVTHGDVKPRIFLERYWPSLIVAALVLLILLSWLRRMIFGSRPTIIVRPDGKLR
jgi:hypothetical protein